MDVDLWEKKRENVFKKMYDKSLELGGLVSGEHGIGFAKKKYMFNQYDGGHLDLMVGIKKSFDPKNILNPGKVCQ